MKQHLALLPWRASLILVALALDAVPAHAQTQPSTPLPTDAPRIIEINAGNFGISFCIGKNQRLYQGRVGAIVPNAPQPSEEEAYPAYGDGSLLENALQVTHADGNTSTVLEVTGQSRTRLDDNGVATRIELKDPAYPFFVTLLFKAYQRENVIEQSVQIRHAESGPVTLHRFASSSPILGGDNYFLTYYHGDWANEANPEEEKLTFGVKTLSLREGTRSQLKLSPFFLLSRGERSSENKGEVIGGALAYSGNFEFQFELSPQHAVRTLIGMNPTGSQYRLDPERVFTTPAMIWSWSNAGRGQLARNFEQWGRGYGMRDGNEPRAVLLNNWEATGFGFTQKKLVELFDDAKALGFELFLLDDGWFGNKYPRNWDGEGLGDWQVNRQKLPDGLGYLTSEAAKRGLRFGLWVEPEMLNPRSDLFEQHPDWFIQQAKRSPDATQGRNRTQLVLDLANPQVRDWMFATVDGILTENPGISYIKWDANRPITQPGSRYLAADRQANLPIDYVQALYDVFGRLAAKHPKVEIMMCSSGGGRVDYGALRFGHEFWPSDNTDPLRRVFMQWNYLQFYPANVISAHVTNWNNRPLKFAFDVAMSARLGMDMDTAKLSAEDKEFSRAAITTYKEIRNVVQLGETYRLESPYENARSSLLHIAKDKRVAVVFAYQIKDGTASRLKLAGLDAAKSYRIKELNLHAGAPTQTPDNDKVVSGATLMKDGLDLSLSKQFDSAVIQLTAEP